MSGNNVNVMNLAGADGGEKFADTDTHTPENSDGYWWCIQAVNGADAVIDDLSSNITGLDGTGLAHTIPSGQCIYGVFTSIALTSGAVICYKA